MEQSNKLLIEQYSEDVTFMLRNSLKYRGSLRTWIKEFKRKERFSDSTPELYQCAAATLLRLDKVVSKYHGNHEDFILENVELFEEMDRYAKKLELILSYNDGVSLILPTNEYVSQCVLANQELNSLPYSCDLYNRTDKFVIKLEAGNGLNIGTLRHPELKNELSEVYFKFVNPSLQEHHFQQIKSTAESEVADYVQNFDRILHLTLVSSVTKSGEPGSWCEEYFFPLGVGEKLMDQLFFILYEYDLPLHCEESLRSIINLTMTIALSVNEKISPNPSSLLISNRSLNS